MNTKTLYQDMLEAGVQLGYWQSDLHVKDSPEARAVMARHPDNQPLPFRSQVDDELWYEFPFQYEPFWADKP